jgi:hypothetical protein
MNTKTKSVGRPAAEIKYPRGIFTMKELFALNRCGSDTGVCKLTVIKHVDAEVQAKFLTLLKDRVMTGKVGKPAHRFIRTAVYKGLKQARKARGGTPVETLVTVEAPAVIATPIPVVEIPTVVIDVPVNEIVSIPAPTPAPAITQEAIVDATLAALAPAI